MAAWIGVGVESAEKAADAVEAGHHPGDPWVKTAPAEFIYWERVLRRPTRARAMINRRDARRAWEREEQEERPTAVQMSELGHAVLGQGASPLAALGFLEQVGEHTSDLVWRALAELDEKVTTTQVSEADELRPYWGSRIRLIDRAAAVCPGGDQRRIRVHLLRITETAGIGHEPPTDGTANTKGVTNG